MKMLRYVCACVVIMLAVYLNSYSQQYDTPPTNVNKQNTNKNDKDNPNSPQYKFAVSMSKDLMNKLALTFEQAEKIRDIILDYQQDVFDIKSRYSTLKNNGTNSTSEKNENTAVRGERSASENDRTNNENNMTGGTTTDKIEAYQDADVDANDKIEDVLKDNQIIKYNDIKKDWWASIKQHVHSQEAFNEMNGTTNNNTNTNSVKSDHTKTDNKNTD